jgi:hypothetical protein
MVTILNYAKIVLTNCAFSSKNKNKYDYKGWAHKGNREDTTYS